MCSVSSADVLALKGATEASYVLGGGVTSFAKLADRAVSTLSKYGSVSAENRDHVIPIHIAVAVDRRAGSPNIIEEAARQLGFRLEPIDAEPRPGHRLTESDGVMVSLEAADVVRAIHDGVERAEKANRTGDIDEFSRQRILKEAHELKRAAENIISALQRVSVTAGQ